MGHPQFFPPSSPMSLADIAEAAEAVLADRTRGGQLMSGVGSLAGASPRHVTFFDNPRYSDDLARTAAGACFVGSSFADRVPATTAALIVRHPFAAFVEIARRFDAAALRPTSGFGLTGIAVSAVVHPTAQIEDDVTIDPLAVIGPNVEIGSGTTLGSGAVIGPGVKIGRDCSIGATTTIQHALIGNDVLIHPGCQIGQDGFGFIRGSKRSVKVPQAGRVIIQHHVEIGSGSTIDRGSLRDTVIGEGSKLDNQVQVAHNVVIGRNTLIAGQCGLAGSLTIGNNVSIGAKVGLNNHIDIGDGAMIGAMSAVKDSIPPGERWAGHYAKPARQWLRGLVAVEQLAREPATMRRERTKDEGRE